jgi:hypothetical protein
MNDVASPLLERNKKKWRRIIHDTRNGGGGGAAKRIVRAIAHVTQTSHTILYYERHTDKHRISLTLANTHAIMMVAFLQMTDRNRKQFRSYFAHHYHDNNC